MRREEVDHDFEAPPVDRREILAARARRETREQQEIEHEGLVAERLLAIAAVGRVLPVAFLLENRRGSARPTRVICGHSGQVEAATYTPAASPIR